MSRPEPAHSFCLFFMLRSNTLAVPPPPERDDLRRPSATRQRDAEARRSLPYVAPPIIATFPGGALQYFRVGMTSTNGATMTMRRVTPFSKPARRRAAWRPCWEGRVPITGKAWTLKLSRIDEARLCRRMNRNPKQSVRNVENLKCTNGIQPS